VRYRSFVDQRIGLDLYGNSCPVLTGSRLLRIRVGTRGMFRRTRPSRAFGGGPGLLMDVLASSASCESEAVGVKRISGRLMWNGDNKGEFL
jgi:hypothetical protein